MGGIYANTGSGRNARPTGAPLVSSTSAAVPATGTGAITLSGAFDITHLNYWAGVIVDNTTAAFDRVTATAGDGSGLVHSQDAASFALETVATLSAAGSYVPWLTAS